MQTQKLQWHTESRKVDSLLPHKKSPRKITKEQTERLKKSLEQFNLVEVPAVQLDGTILAGHQRIKVLQLLGRGAENIDAHLRRTVLREVQFVKGMGERERFGRIVRDSIYV